MNEFDSILKAKFSEDDTEIPETVKGKIEKTLAQLPEKEYRTVNLNLFVKIVSVAACFLFVFLVALPNVSPAYAQVLDDIPIIGDIIDVVTVRNYFYSDDYHELDISVPKLEGVESNAASYINKSVEDLTKILADRFDEDLKEIGNEAHTSLYVDYKVVTNTDRWFTLQITVFEAAGSSNTYYEYYHIDKAADKIVKLGDIVKDDAFYSVVKNDILRQMHSQMTDDPDLVYWVEESVFGKDLVDIGSDHNFYWNENGDIVIVFDKYEVAPGFMGTPEFTVAKELITDYIN